jgi:aminoglycoside phosphotransferase (APT) family kinase protein
VLPWLPGAPADQAPPDPGEADAVAGFLAALHEPAPDGAPRNPVRGVPLSVRAPSIAERLDALRAASDAVTPEVEATWARALAAPPAPDARWLHGDLHPRNVLVERGRLSAVVDWGDVTAGDVATDLASIWMLFAEHEARRRALATYLARVAPLSEPADAVETRARGWAVLFGVVLLATGLLDQPRHAAIGTATLARITEDADRGSPARSTAV